MDVAEMTDGTDDAAVAQLMGKWGFSEDDAHQEPSDAEDTKKKTTTEEDHEAEDDGDKSEREDAPDEDADEDSGESEGDDSDPLNIVFKHVVEGEEREFKARDLLRLAGQEAAITRKGQEVSQRRQAIDEAAAVHVAQHSKLLERAQARYEPYKNIDWMALTKNPDISAEEASAIQAQARAAWDDLKFLEGGAQELHKQINTQRQTALAEQAKEAVKVLTDPEKGIKGWNEQMYRDIVSFAKDTGIPQEALNELVDPAAIKIIHMAMLYKRGADKTVKTTGTKKTAPKKIIKTSHNREAVRQTTGKAQTQDAMQRLKRSGSDQDAVAAMLARWNPSED